MIGIGAGRCRERQIGYDAAAAVGDSPWRKRASCSEGCRAGGIANAWRSDQVEAIPTGESPVPPDRREFGRDRPESPLSARRQVPPERPCELLAKLLVSAQARAGKRSRAVAPLFRGDGENPGITVAATTVSPHEAAITSRGYGGRRQGFVGR